MEISWDSLGSSKVHGVQAATSAKMGTALECISGIEERKPSLCNGSSGTSARGTGGG